MKPFICPGRQPAWSVLLATAMLYGASGLARAQSGTWTNLSGGSWAASANWSNSVIASGSGNTADFSQLTLSAAPTVTLDGAQTIGNLIFGDLGNTYGWTLNTGSAGPLTLAVSSGSPTITVNNQTNTIGLVLAGTDGLTKNGPGTLIVGTANTYSGGTVVNQGFIQISNITGNLGSGATVSVLLNGGGLICSFAANDTPTWPVTVGANGGEMDLIAAGRWMFTANTLYGSGTLTLKPEQTRFQLDTQTNSGFSGEWIIDGSGRAPSFNNGYIVATAVNADTYFGTAPASFTPNAITLVNNGGIQGGAATGTSLGSATRGIMIGSGGGSFIASGAYNVNVYSQISGTTGDPVYFENGATTGGWELNVPCTYNGNTIIYEIQLVAATIHLRLGTNNVIPYGPGMGLLGFGGLATPTLDLNGFNQTINGFVPNNSIGAVDDQVAGGTSTLTVGSANTSSSFAGVIQNTTGTVNLVQIGTGTLTLTGTNTYSGSTTVSNGTLAISTGLQTGGGPYMVADGATLDLNVASTALSMSALTLGSNAGCALELDFSSSPSTSVAPVQAGSLTANAVTLNVNFGGGVAVGQYPLIQYSGSIGGAGFSAFTLVTVPPSPASMMAHLVNDTANSSIDVDVTVAPSSTVALASSPNPSVPGQPVIFTANATNGGAPGTGTVTFQNGSTTMGSSTLNGSGVASFTYTFTAISTNSITAIYNGVTSFALSQVVNAGLLTWSGAVNGVWDVNTTSNWLNLGAPWPYYQGSLAQFDDTALSNTAITLNVAVSPGSFTVTNNSRNYTLSGTGSVSGSTGLLKTGTGALTVSTVNNYLGMTVVSNGVLTFSGAGSVMSSGDPGDLFVGAGSGTAVLNMNSTGGLLFATYESLGGITGDTNDNGSGAVYQTTGTIEFGGISGGNAYVAYPLEIGAGGSNAYGYYSLSGGTLYAYAGDTIGGLSISVGAIGQGVFVQTGGSLTVPEYLDVGTYSGGSGNGGTGVATFIGGTATIGAAIRLGVEPNGNGVMNLGTEAGGSATVIDSSVDLLAGSGATNAVLNLDGGTLQLTSDITTGSGSGTAALNLNGGTLRDAANTTIISGSLGNVLLFNGGVVIDTQSYTETESYSLQSATGNGIYPAGGILTLTTNGGSKYIGAPLVTVSGGSGAGATAIATVSNGVVTNLTLTCPGQNYLAGDILSFAFAGGGTATPASTFNYTLKAGDVAANASGTLTKIGSGTLVLNGYSSYTNNTVVSNGTLEMDGSVASPIIVAGGMLDGIGYTPSPVVVQGGGTLGSGSAGIVGQPLTIQSTLSLSGMVSLRIDNTGGNLIYDYVQGMTSVSYGGTLTVTNVTIDGTPLAVGDSFTLFNASAYSGSFSTVNLPLLGGGLAWSIANLAANGSIQVIGGVSTNQPSLTHAISGGLLNLSWPSDHTGWRLLVQTNHLAQGLSLNISDWGTVPDSALTNQVSLPIQESEPAEFYRLVYP